MMPASSMGVDFSPGYLTSLLIQPLASVPSKAANNGPTPAFMAIWGVN